MGGTAARRGVRRPIVGREVPRAGSWAAAPGAGGSIREPAGTAGVASVADRLSAFRPGPAPLVAAAEPHTGVAVRRPGPCPASAHTTVVVDRGAGEHRPPGHDPGGRRWPFAP